MEANSAWTETEEAAPSVELQMSMGARIATGAVTLMCCTHVVPAVGRIQAVVISVTLLKERDSLVFLLGQVMLSWRLPNVIELLEW